MISRQHKRSNDRELSLPFAPAPKIPIAPTPAAAGAEGEGTSTTPAIREGTNRSAPEVPGRDVSQPGEVSASPANVGTVGIYDQNHNVPVIRWLCDACNKARVAANWTSKRIGEVVGRCDDCELRRQREEKTT